MRVTETSDVWWKNAVVYCLDVETFLDSDGDGVGDLPGLAQRIDYLAELGITCLWLMPLYPSPRRDDGYDITDFYGVDPRLGTPGDLVEVIRTAKDRGIRVIVDLVVNHTSDQHPWFVSSRSSRESPHRDWYVWVDEPPDDPSVQPVFPDAEDSVWEFDEKTGQYYLHHFYRYQPDLNVSNPEVRQQLATLITYWMQLGVSGFRVDAVPFLLETVGMVPDQMPDPHAILRHLRGVVNRSRGDAMLLGEVNLEFDQQREYFGAAGDEITMQFDFNGMQALYLSLARRDAGPLARALAARPEIPPDCQWATFVRNHDELTLDKLSDDERQEVFAAFGPDPSMQVYGRGLRRRLPPMLDGDRDRLRMVYSLLFSLPGTPVLFYGEEIGMGENLALPGREAVRTPMQWSDGTHGGFSTCAAQDLKRPMVEGDYGPEHVNVQDQRRDPESFLRFMSLLIARYRQCPELGWGQVRLLDVGQDAVLAHAVTHEQATVVALHNLGEEPVQARFTVPDAGEGDTLVDLLQDATTPIPAGGEVTVDLPRYGYRWLRVTPPGDRRLL